MWDVCVEPKQRGKVGQHEYKISPARQWCGLQEGREKRVYFSACVYESSVLPEKICRWRCGRLKHGAKGALVLEHAGIQVILTKRLIRTWKLACGQGARQKQMFTSTQTSASEHWFGSKSCMPSFHTDPALSHLTDTAHISGQNTGRHMKESDTIVWSSYSLLGNKEQSKERKILTSAHATYKTYMKIQKYLLYIQLVLEEN